MIDIDDIDTCGDCLNNWQGEECEIDGHEIFDDSIACENFEPKDMI